MKKVANRLDAIILAGIAASIGLGSCVSCDARPAEAQDAPHTRTTLRPLSLTERDDIARCLISEGDGRQSEMVPILAVIARRAEQHGMRWATFARAYCAVFDPRTAHTRRIASILALPGTRSSWSAHWPVALETIDAYRAGLLLDTCGEPATDWGDARGDAARARHAGWREVHCGSTRNVFWTSRRAR